MFLDHLHWNQASAAPVYDSIDQKHVVIAFKLIKLTCAFTPVSLFGKYIACHPSLYFPTLAISGKGLLPVAVTVVEKWSIITAYDSKKEHESN